MINGRFTYTPAAADTDAYALSQTLASAGTLLLNGTNTSGGLATHPGVCVIRETRDNQFRSVPGSSLLTITSLGSDESGIVFTITGTNAAGKAETDTVTGPTASATVSSSVYFATITQIQTDGAIVGNIEAGISVNQITVPLRPSQYSFEPFIVQTDVSGTLVYTIQATADSSPIESTDIPYVNMCDFSGSTGDGLGNIITPLGALRINITSFTSGTIQLILGESTQG